MVGDFVCLAFLANHAIWLAAPWLRKEAMREFEQLKWEVPAFQKVEKW